MASSKNETKNEPPKTAENGAVNTTGNSTAKQESSGTGASLKNGSKTRESVYTVDEFCNNAQSLFNAMPECVRAALTEKGIKQCNKGEAEKIVKEFMRKEIK